MWSARCACAAALGRIRAAVCLRACMHAILLLGWHCSEATTVIGVGTGQMSQNNRMLFSNSVSGYEPRNTGGALELITYFLRRFQRFVQPYRTETNTASEQLCYKGNALPFSSSRE
jgi:hypothetical protein